MIPIFKLVSLIIRLFTKPMTNYFKQSLKSGNIKRPVMRNSIMYLGQHYHRLNIRITRAFANTGGTEYIKPLADEKALDSGAEFIGELIAYGTLLTWGIYEVNKLSKDTKLKEQKLNDQISSLVSQLDSVKIDYQNLASKIEDLRAELELKTQKTEVSIPDGGIDP